MNIGDAKGLLSHAPTAQSGAAGSAGSTNKLREVARQFESLFTHMLFKNMRAASLGDGMLDSEQSKFYRDMFDQQMANELAQGQGLGIAELLVRQLGESRPSRPPAAEPAALAMPTRASRTVNDTERQPSGPLAFVKKALPHARRIGQALGVAPRFILAQAALESGWGRRPIRTPDGSDSHNLFGIKAGSTWSGPRAIVGTLEFSKGVAQRVNAAFRAYGSMAESFDDYARLLMNSPRYQDALRAGEDGAAFAGALADGGYATDPGYAEKILRIADGETLENAMSVLKIP